jgi:hypothetical protein
VCPLAVNQWLTKRGRPPIPKLTKKEKAAFYEMFDSMDADGSGTLSRLQKNPHRFTLWCIETPILQSP